ncbi:MAG: hypothetical protein QF632_06740, partial [Candidatus Woesearchaeota archaeon]|nr:hypothetical protein [Candidatus Woesearchaeota archaeon]
NALLRYFIGDDDKLDTLIMCKSTEIQLVTSDQSLYEALGSIQDSDGFKIPKLVKLLEVIDVVSYVAGTREQRKILKEERVKELRTFALKTIKKSEDQKTKESN